MAVEDPVDIRRWLRSQPQPARLRVRSADGDERFIELDEAPRNRWTHAEQSIRASQAYVVECLNSDGAILRSLMLGAETDDPSLAAGSPEEKEDRHIERRLATERREFAAALDRYGHRLNEAFERGVAASSTQQDQLIGLVETLTTHLSTAITSLHNVSVNFANTMQSIAKGEEPDQHSRNEQALTSLLGAAVGKVMANGVSAKEEKP